MLTITSTRRSYNVIYNRVYIFILIFFYRLDFELERYHLWRDALPALQQHCVQYGLDVVWTDVHYGSEIDHVKDAYRFERHIEEIEQCNQQSVGPFFVVRYVKIHSQDRSFFLHVFHISIFYLFQTNFFATLQYIILRFLCPHVNTKP